MSGFDVFLTHYGLVAVFSIMLIKTIGVPIPIPDDLFILTEAVRVAQGKLVGKELPNCIEALLAVFDEVVLTRGLDEVELGKLPPKTAETPHPLPSAQTQIHHTKI